MTSEHFDRLETRDPDARERDFFGRLPSFIALAMRAPGWATQLAGIDPNAVTSRAELAKLPLLRKSELADRQKEQPPFGGFNVTAPGRMRRLLMSPGPIFEPEGEGKDFWGAARALFAAGFRPGDVVHNCFSYHLTPGGFMLESGAHALGCAVIPAGTGNTEQQLAAIAHFKPVGYLGTPDFLKILLDAAAAAGKDASSLQRALVSGGALPLSLRQELAGRGVKVLQCYATADLGVVAYECEEAEGLIVNETLLVEIVRPGTGDPVAASEVGEVVVTSVQPGLSDDPLCHRRSFGGDAGTFAERADQHAHRRLDGPRRPGHEGQGHVRASRPGGRGRQASSRARPVTARRDPRRRAGRDDPVRGMLGAIVCGRVAGRGCSHAAVGDEAPRRGQVRRHRAACPTTAR